MRLLLSVGVLLSLTTLVKAGPLEIRQIAAEADLTSDAIPEELEALV